VYSRYPRVIRWEYDTLAPKFGFQQKSDECSRSCYGINPCFERQLGVPGSLHARSIEYSMANQQLGSLLCDGQE